MFVDDLFNKKTLTENRGGGSPWHSEPEQQQMDANRRGRLGRERNAGLDEPDDAPSGSASTSNGVYEYTVPAGQESVAQELGLQQHRGHWVSRVPIQRANFQFGRPQFHEIPSQGVAEGAQDFNKIKTSYDQASRMFSGEETQGFTIEVLLPNEAVFEKIQDTFKMFEKQIGTYLIEKEDSIEGNGIGALIISPLRQGARNAQRSYNLILDLIQKSRGQFNKSTGVTIYKQTQGMAEGMLDNPGEQDSPVASAIIRRILLQRIDLLSKYGPEKVGQAVDEVADFVGDVDEIGSSDVSGWVKHVEQMLGNMQEGYNVVPGINKDRYQERQGLEGPFNTKSGKVVYYDKQEGKYYDPDTDMYIEYDDWQAMNEQGVAEGEGRFAGDTPANVGGATMKMIQVGDIVKYFGQKAEVAALSKDRKRARITIEKGMGGVTQDVNTSDLKQLGQGMAEGAQINELFGFGQDLEKQIAKKENELKALKAKMASRTTTNAGIQTGATALIDPDTGRPYEKDKLAAMYGYKEPEAAAADDAQAGETPPAPIAQTPAQIRAAKQKAAAVTAQGQMSGNAPVPVAQTPAQIRAAKQTAAAATAQGQMSGNAPVPVAQTPAATTATPTPTATNPVGFNASNVMKLPGMEKYAKPAAPAKTANFAGPSGYGKTTTSIKPPAAPSSSALGVPKAPAAPKVTSGGPTPAEKAALDKRIAAAAAAAPAVAETLAQVERMLESVNSKKSADMIRAYVDQKFTELGLRNTNECRNLMARVVQESAVRRRAYAQRMAK